ncbi:hypothetical protein SARC_08563 [Sphaeroforma arctica JP610]|uniref:Uncharacterized protein n=1 Tax=Sphaeroforma arctica JP610 TaxID=667725 RepID=A0A0L0FQI2_9EUKA|nr:hypothetical protein SARC_08563 [Sphaeroforma arctica JP610]KNC79037.1 hypothetical protein SARC_08563 [Sphaeroforma arctica JP610]|eukprot:XP_014152939.1 hypothetical protein SARC_08563 [Sphaeroforma arctica JP610]
MLCTTRVNGKDLTIKGRELNPEDDDVEVDINFFEQSYSPAGLTGFTIWEASWVMVRNVLQDRLKDKLQGARVVELGAGTAFSSLVASALGANVLVTDLEAVVMGSILPNIIYNENENSTTDINTPTSSSAWQGSRRVGEGSVSAMSLDWMTDVALQVIDNDPRDADLILAADTVWLCELIEPFVTTCVTLMKGPKNPPLYMTFRDRSTDKSTVFAGSDELFECFRRNNCEVNVLDKIDPEDKRKGGLVTLCLIKLASS